jgi:hypothetical protein
MSFEFNVDTVVSIKTNWSKEMYNYVWLDKEIIIKKYFFCLFKKEHIIEEGFYDSDYPRGERKKSIEYFERYGYVILDNKIYSRARVEISFLNGDSRGYFFNTDTEANSFIDKVKKESNKTYL